MIRTLIVDDSPLCRDVVAGILQRDPELGVVGIATDGDEAVRQVIALQPDLILMDVRMPRMDGVEATRQIMAQRPTPILIMTTAAVLAETDIAFRAIAHGALDVVDKAVFGPSGEHGHGALFEHLKTLAGVHVVRHTLISPPPVAHLRSVAGVDVIALTASTGGPRALAAVLGGLPAGLPCGIVIVQHISTGFSAGLAEWLDGQVSLRVRLAVDGERLRQGVAYVAPCERHLRVISGGRLALSDEPPCEGHRPSATVLMASVAASYGPRALGVILTGMGCDGVAGLVDLKARGGKVIAQDEKTSTVFGMPGAAVEAGVADMVLPLDRIAGAIADRCGAPTRRVG